MAKANFCCVDNYSVLIPYRDLEKMLESVKFSEQLSLELGRVQQQLDSLRVMYTELCLKVREIEKIV